MHEGGLRKAQRILDGKYQQNIRLRRHTNCRTVLKLMLKQQAVSMWEESNGGHLYTSVLHNKEFYDQMNMYQLLN
jgi:hypothetical protein